MEESAVRDVDELAEIHAIKQLKARYVRAADTKDWEAYRNVLTEDFHFDSDGGIQDGRDTVVEMVSSSLADASTVHHVFNPEITITGPDTAEAVWPMEDYVRMTLHGQPYAFHGCGHYTESYVKTADGWRIKRCKLTRLRVDTIDLPLQELRDIEAIKQLKGAFCRLFDTQDFDAWAELLTEDFYLESDAGVHEGRDVVVEMVSKGMAGGSTVHHLFTPEIALTGPDTATGTWAMEDWVHVTVNGEPMSFHGFGHYHEDYVRTAAGWKVKRSVERRLRVDQLDG